jgi:glycosyltransferase involved in cell wall biosynthesis
MSSAALAIDLAALYEHPDSRLEISDNALVVTPSEQWAFAASVRLDLPDVPQRHMRTVSVDLEVIEGQVGVLLIDGEGSAVEEHEVSDDEGSVRTELTWPPVAGPVRLVVRNTREGGRPSSCLLQRITAGALMALVTGTPVPVVARRLWEVARSVRREVRPVPFAAESPPASGCGVYVRTDFWHHVDGGGSHTQTCFIAKELSRVLTDLVVLVPNRFPQLDEFNVRQAILPCPRFSGSELSLMAGALALRKPLRMLLEAMRPAFVYEQLCIGSVGVAEACRDLAIPYVVEWNGPEDALLRLTGSPGYENAEVFDACEDAAFAQASIVVTPTTRHAHQVVARGADPQRVLVNLPGVDTDLFRPAEPGERDTIRESLGFAAEHEVIGWSGTFLPWHGVDTLVPIIASVFADRPLARLLLIGDGATRAHVEAVIREYGLADRVLFTGWLPSQSSVAAALRSCDALVFPHVPELDGETHSPIGLKIFEFLASGVPVVGPDVGDLRELLRPGLLATELDKAKVEREHAVLCSPRSAAEEFFKAISYLFDNTLIARRLGKNARAVAEARFTWSEHVRRLWDFANQLPRL